jgi:hypothetical protein
MPFQGEQGCAGMNPITSFHGDTPRHSGGVSHHCVRRKFQAHLERGVSRALDQNGISPCTRVPFPVADSITSDPPASLTISEMSRIPR